MARFSHIKKGFTIIEVLISFMIMLIFLPFAANMLTNSQTLASYAKHKTEAAYAAQQIIETQRQQPFVSISAGPPIVPVTIGPASVVLDTKGNYSNTNCATNPNLFCGTAVITITPAVYTSNQGVTTTNPSIDHYVVQISWKEQVLNLQTTMTETYAEDIANDPMLN